MKKSISTNKRLYGEKEMKFEVKGSGLTKVYFSCCPDDFENWFEIISDEILEKASNCSIYYLKNQNYYPDEDEIDEYYDYLSQFSLFVIVMSRNSYNTDNRSKVIDFNYAKQYASHLLPISVDEDSNWYLDHHERQILDRNDKLTYEERLSRYLKTSIVDEPTAKKIKEAFDDYVFLSYRKKDKAYVNKVLSSIYKNKAMRDVAVWWDNYLTPGEKYSEEITENISKSKAMVLLVTPSVLEKGNYIIDIEYPQATNFKKEVLPIEAEDTDKDCLSVTFKGIKTPIVLDDSSLISDSLVKLLHRENIKENDDPEHLYYIALAYLNGFEVEKNFREAISLLKSSSDGGCLLAKPVLRDLLQENGFSEKAIELQYELVNSDEYMTNCDMFKEKIKYADLLIDNGHYIDALELLRNITVNDDCMNNEKAIIHKLEIEFYLAKIYCKIDVKKLIEVCERLEDEDHFNDETIEYIHKYAGLLRKSFSDLAKSARDKNINLRYDKMPLRLMDLTFRLLVKEYNYWKNKLCVGTCQISDKNRNVSKYSGNNVEDDCKLIEWHRSLEKWCKAKNSLATNEADLIKILTRIATRIMKLVIQIKHPYYGKVLDPNSYNSLGSRWSSYQTLLFEILERFGIDTPYWDEVEKEEKKEEQKENEIANFYKKRIEIYYAYNELFTIDGNTFIEKLLQSIEVDDETVEICWDQYKTCLKSNDGYSKYTIKSLSCFENSLYKYSKYEEVVDAYEWSLLVADKINVSEPIPSLEVIQAYDLIGKRLDATRLCNILIDNLHVREKQNDNQRILFDILKKYSNNGNYDIQLAILKFSAQNQPCSISNELELFLNMVINHQLESAERLVAFRKVCEIIENINIESGDEQLRLKVIFDIYDSTLHTKFKDNKITLEITEKKDFWLDRIDKLYTRRGSRNGFDDSIDCQWCGENIDIYLNYHVYRSDEKVKSVLIDYLREFNNELTFELREELKSGIKKMCDM